MFLKLDQNQVTILAQTLFNEISHMRDMDATGCECYDIATKVLNFILNADVITIDDNLPF